MARALLSKQVDDEVEVITPLGKKCGISIKFAMKNLKIRNF
jgi:transcription elongation GreA/GreB family factor